jgi:hypothetical protein
MAAISHSLSHGVEGFNISDFTVGTSAPGTGDFEFRSNTTDTNSANISHFEMIRAIKAFIRALEQGGSAPTYIAELSGGNPPPPLL